MKISHYFKTLCIEKVQHPKHNEYVAYIEDCDLNYFYVIYFSLDNLTPFRNHAYLDDSKYSNIHKLIPLKKHYENI